MRKLKILFALIFIPITVLFLTSCEGKIEVHRIVDISGYVINSTGSYIDQASVSLYGENGKLIDSTYTKNGSFRFFGIRADQRVEILAEKVGYESKFEQTYLEDDIDLWPIELNEVSYNPSPDTVTVSGIIRNNQGDRLINAFVCIYVGSSSSPDYYNYTDGYFSYAAPYGEDISVYVSKVGYNPQSITLSNIKENNTLNFLLTEEEAFTSISGNITISSGTQNSILQNINKSSYNYQEIKVYAVRDFGDGVLEKVSNEVTADQYGDYYIPEVEIRDNIKVIGWLDTDEPGDEGHGIINIDDFYGKSDVLTLYDDMPVTGVDFEITPVTEYTQQNTIKTLDVLLNTTPK